jgi:hypothetical protein
MDSGVPYRGVIDELRISNVVRTPAELAAAWNGGAGVPFTADASTLALYHFDDATGQSMLDASSHARHGTLGYDSTANDDDPTWEVAPTNGTAYHWRARSVDAMGGVSSWVSFGGNADSLPADTDFVLVSAAGAGGNAALPRLLSTLPAEATCHEPYRYVEGALPQVEGTGPFSYRLDVTSGTAPVGLQIDEYSGELRWTPLPADVGAYRLAVTVTSPSGSVTKELDVEVSCGATPKKGCGCGAAQGAPLSFALAALLASWRGSRSRR